MGHPIRLKRYNVTGAAGSTISLRCPVGYSWLVQQVIVSTDAAGDANDLAVVYSGSVAFDSIICAAPLDALASASVVTFTLNGAVEIQEDTILATVETGAGQLSLTIYVEEHRLSYVRQESDAPGAGVAILKLANAFEDDAA